MLMSNMQSAHLPSSSPHGTSTPLSKSTVLATTCRSAVHGYQGKGSSAGRLPRPAIYTPAITPSKGMVGHAEQTKLRRPSNLKDAIDKATISLIRLIQIHEQDQLLSMWGPDKPFMEPSKALRHLSMYFAGLIAFGVTVKYALIPERLAVPREFPFDGLVKELGGIEANKVRLW